MTTTPTPTTPTPPAWAHLPNAAHIDRILADAKARPHAGPVGEKPEDYGLVYEEVANAYRVASDAAARAGRGEAAAAVLKEPANFGCEACLALVAWDEASDLLYLPDAVRMLASCGHLPALLLLPACIALNKS